MFKLACAGCGQILAIPDEYAGRVGKCRHCGSQVTAPPLLPNFRPETANSPTAEELQESRVPQEPPERDSIPVSDVSPECNSEAGPVYSMTGVQDVLEVYEDRLAITPKGVLAFFNKGLKGRKEIPFASIVAIQLKKHDYLSNGYIQFTISGGIESRGGIFAAVRDENTVVFRGEQNNALADEICLWINKQPDAARSIKPTNSTPTLSSELEKLASLRDSGILSNEEFTAAKTKLLQ